MYTENVIRDLQGSAEALKEVESEWAQLEEDRRLLRKIFPKVSCFCCYLSCVADPSR